METKFQTSFIPKKPLIAETPGTSTKEPISLFLIIGVFIFILSLASVAGVYAWEKVLVSEQVQYKKTLQENRDAFGQDQLDKFKKLNIKIDIAKAYLDAHLATSQLFGILSKLTIETIRFKSFDYAPPTDKDPIKITMSGEGVGFEAIAFQSDVLANAQNDFKVKNAILGGLSLGDNGLVSFTFTGELSPTNIQYKDLFVTAPAPVPDAQVGETDPIVGAGPVDEPAQ